MNNLFYFAVILTLGWFAGSQDPETTTLISVVEPQNLTLEQETTQTVIDATTPAIGDNKQELSSIITSDDATGTVTVIIRDVANIIKDNLPASMNPNGNQTQDEGKKPQGNDVKLDNGPRKGNQTIKLENLINSKLPSKLERPPQQLPIRRNLTNPIFDKYPNGTEMDKKKSNGYVNSDEVVRSRPMSIYDLARDWMKHERKTSFLRLVDKYGFDAAVMFNRSLTNEKLEALTWTGDKPPKPKKWLVSSDSAKLIEGRK